MKLLILLCLSVFFCQLPASHGWCFDFLKKNKIESGDDCARGAGIYQSPINIVLDKAERIKEDMLQWKNYKNIPRNMTITNNGHSIQLSAEWSSEHDVPYLTSGPLKNDQYVFEQLHFHWGKRNSIGSEHTIGGKSYSLEMHLVHWKRNYGSMQNATNYPDGVTVVGAFYDTSRKQSVQLGKILNSVNQITMPKRSRQIKVFPLCDLEIVNIKRNYVTYSGSLTGPQCPEVVTWIIGLPVYQISKDQMEKIRSVELNNGADNNNRPTQPLNDRPVYHVTRLHVGEL